LIPPACVRLRALTQGQLADRLQARAAVHLEPSPHLETCVRVTRGGDLSTLMVAHDFVVQEEGSQLLAHSLPVSAGARVLDACAGRGNKSLLLADLKHAACIDAADLHSAKLERLALEHAAAGHSAPYTFAVDWSAGVGAARGPYDVILLDAPCSGLGTLRRRPDILLRRTQESLLELTELQRQILRNVASLLKPGGYLLYVVCSVLQSESEDVCDAVASACGLAPAPLHGPLAALFPGATRARLLPHVHGTDGYFAAAFTRAE
jgi:16S rRNA (cytosine967-C5)-methyltransferase